MFSFDALISKATGLYLPSPTVDVEQLQSLVSVLTGKIVDCEGRLAEQAKRSQEADQVFWIIDALKEEVKVAESSAARAHVELDELRKFSADVQLKLELQGVAAADSAEATNAKSAQPKLCENKSSSVTAVQATGTQTCMLTDEVNALQRQVYQMQAQLSESQRQHDSIREQLWAERCTTEEMTKACGAMRELHMQLEQQLATERAKAKEQEKMLSTAAEVVHQVDKLEKACAELTHKLELEITHGLANTKELNKARSDAEELRSQLAFTKGELDREEKRKLNKAGDCVDLKKQCYRLEQELQEALEDLAAAEDELEAADHMLLAANYQAAKLEEWRARLSALSDAKHCFQSKHAAALVAVARREAAIASQEGAHALPLTNELSAALAEALAQWVALTEQQPACKQEPLTSVLSPPLSSDASSVSE